MSEVRGELRGNIYNQPFRSHFKKKSIETRETNELLPSIKSQHSLEKNNNLRNQVNQTKEQITAMQARLNKLRHLKNEFENKTKHNRTKIDFIQHVQDRVQRDHLYKETIRKQRHESLMQLKGQTEHLRESLVREKKEAEDSLFYKKAQEAEQERRRQREHDYLIKKLKELDQKENAKKAQKIREFHDQSASKLKQFYSSRVSLSKDNYQMKLQKTLGEREKANRTLSRLKSEEEQLIAQVKSSQKTMLSSLYSLVTLNPEKRMRRSSYFKSSEREETQEKQLDVDDYEKEEFQKGC